MIFLVLTAALLLPNDSVVKIEGDAKIDIARSTRITVTPKGVDLRERFVGFSLAEDYDDDQANCTHWKLTPEPCAKVYKIRPFAFAGAVHGPVYFEMPDVRESVTGGMEVDPKKDFPGLSWKLVGEILAALVALAGVVFLVWWLVRTLARKVREHRMSPIERAWAELERLLKKGLPGRGRYKDFYVELTMVVRRYIQRKYGIRAPNLTTEEFFGELLASRELPEARVQGLRDFLTNADLVKFAGVEATSEMSDAATESARGYLQRDSAEAAK